MAKYIIIFPIYMYTNMYVMYYSNNINFNKYNYYKISENYSETHTKYCMLIRMKLKYPLSQPTNKIMTGNIRLCVWAHNLLKLGMILVKLYNRALYIHKFQSKCQENIFQNMIYFFLQPKNVCC